MKHIEINTDAISKLKTGINKVADIVAGTLGPCGSNVILRKPYNNPMIVNDGVSIAKEITLEDPIENAGAELLTAAAINTNSLVGDGTTTTCILTRGLVNEGFSILEKEPKVNPILLREQLNRITTEDLLPELDSIAEKITTPEQIKHVATISVGGNEKIGELVAEAFNKVGAEGVVHLENNMYPETRLDVVAGYKIDRGYMTPYAINDTEKFVVDYENCLVLCCYHKIRERADVEPLFRWANQNGRPILLILEDIDESLFGGLQVNLMRKNFKICPVKAPGFGFNVRDYMNDISKLTGCIVYADDTKPMSKFSPEDFGSASKVLANRESTCIIRDQEIPTEDLNSYIESLKNQLKNTENGHLRDSLKERISKLNAGVATIFVGATSETEQTELRLRIEDAINATRAALKEGIVPGAGATFAYLASKMVLSEGTEPTSIEEYKALEILNKVLKQIEIQVCENSGMNVVFPTVQDRNWSEGVDGKTKCWCNLKESGIVDPVLVLKSAIKNSVSIASTILTTNATIIADDKE